MLNLLQAYLDYRGRRGRGDSKPESRVLASVPAVPALAGYSVPELGPVGDGHGGGCPHAREPGTGARQYRGQLSVSNDAIPDAVSPSAPPSPEKFETSQSELDRLVGTYRAAYKRLDTTRQGGTLGEAAHHLHDLADRIQRLDPGFDFTTLHLEEGAAPITEPIPQVPVKAKSACYVCGGLEHWRTGGDRQPRKCSTCHPPANPDGIERERLEVETGDEAWDEETAWLLEWQATAPTPSEAFWLRNGVWVSDPARFMARLRADAAHGPGGPRARTGAFQADLQALWGLFGGEDAR